MLMLEGHVSLEHDHHAGPGHGPPNDSGCRIDRVAGLQLNLHGEGLSGRIEFKGGEDAGHHVLDDDGHGMLSGFAHVFMQFDELPELQFEEIFGEVYWVEIPIQLDDGLLMMSPEGAVSGFDLFPVSPEIGMLFNQAREVLSGNRMMNEGDPCQEAAMAYVEDLKDIFSSCFPTFSEMDD